MMHCRCDLGIPESLGIILRWDEKEAVGGRGVGRVCYVRAGDLSPQSCSLGSPEDTPFNKAVREAWRRVKHWCFEESWKSARRHKCQKVGGGPLGEAVAEPVKVQVPVSEACGLNLFGINGQ